ncbi:penicillin-binding protein 2 [Wolbachia endosymbiont of Atemnus politus]|uniref:peptidoglycan D,D-transpeptidase FtsI family protein n=1 Tax=Wolbachia endosymbiont of Atemnus politus TaxID=2682840 RepID=UPI0015720791|nr:penicillin-binding protein 2 [Wolbachia endosymbiont of Atemnus politus]NSM56152.1 penicillin-binding protein 2 [Wolbachia endosymbiont of Atemnus politus]NSX82975.1 penicillin-binding protein 2 [Wolbachia endosymbiont of Atemnus politus]
MQVLLKNKLRSLYFIVPLFIFYIIIIFRILSLTFNQFSAPENLKKSIKAYRQPDILDRNGVVIATNVPTTSLYIDSTKVRNPESMAAQLCSILDDLEYEDLYKTLTSKKKFAWIKRHLTPKELLAVKTAGVPGVNFYNDVKRIYPHSNLFSHILGYTDIDGKGIAGVEVYVSKNSEQEKSVVLSLDLRVQSVVHEELARAISRYQALGGVGIVLNVKNSEIISMVSLPDFNPNLQNKAKDVQKFNRASLGVYEMGSILKFFTIAAALDANVVKTSDLYDVSRPITIGEYKIQDLHKFATPQITVRDIFVQSSNIGAAKIAAKLGIERQVEYFKTMKLFSPLKIEIPEKSTPIIPDKWSESTLITASYGYGIAVTPMHIAQTAAALINNGIFHNATLILNKRSIGEQIIAKSTSREIRKLLRATVTDGTGKRANIKAYSIGGKTGSAEKVISGKYSKDANIASFIGALTMLDPRYIVLIIIDEPQGMYHTGGMIAAPVAKNIINKIAPILGVTPET